ncbi:MAG: FHA domain-containing protein [Thermoanaerobaculaceae bacterium]
MEPPEQEAVEHLLPLTTHAVPIDMAVKLDALCRAVEAGTAGEPIDTAAVHAGVQALIEVPSLPVSPAVPGVAWTAHALGTNEPHGVVTQATSAVGEILTLHRLADGSPTVGTWARLGAPPQVASFHLTRQTTGWELVIRDMARTFRQRVEAVPTGLAWATPAAVLGLPAPLPSVTPPPVDRVPQAPQPPPLELPGPVGPAEPRPPVAVCLVFHSGPTPFEEVALTGRVVIGREADCDLRLDDPGVSRHHAAVEPTAGGARVTDLGSSNGTFVDGRRIESPSDLVAGDEIVVGHTHLTLGRLQETPPATAELAAAPPTPAPPEPPAPRQDPAEGPAARPCPGCGRLEPDAAGRFCRGCGQALPAIAPAPVPSACLQCGGPLRAGERFCTRCGRKVV